MGEIFCLWDQNRDGDWETSCDNIHSFIEGDVSENNYQYCPYCGRSIHAVPYDSED